MRVLIAGGRGQLGQALVRIGRARGWDALAMDRYELDVTNRLQVDEVISGSRADLVVNAAAYTAVDRAESEPEAVMAVNRDGAANLAESCAARGLPLVHLSTDYVFDGRSERPYRENDPVHPLSAYGTTKAAGETVVRERLQRHLILRTSWLFGLDGPNFVKTMIALGREREELRVVDDQTGSPTFADDLAEAILKAGRVLALGAPPVRGTYHFCGNGRTTWFDMAQRIFQTARAYENLKVQAVIPIPTDQYPAQAARPRFSVLDCTRFETDFGLKPPLWEDGLERMIKALYEQGKA